MKRMLHPRDLGRRCDAEASASTSKLNADWEFLPHLRDVGRARAEAWLAGDFDGVGVRSTVDIREKYL